MNSKLTFSTLLISVLLLTFGCQSPSARISPQKNDRIAFIGGNLCSRMINYGHLETAIQASYPQDSLLIRNMCDGGDRPGFRPHSGRDSAWVFPDASAFQDEYAQPSGSIGHFRYPDEWLDSLDIDIILAFFGYSESFEGAEGLDNFKAELSAFVEHTLAQKYNDQNAPDLALVSPIAFEDLSEQYDLPDGTTENEHLAMYTQAIREVAETYELPFVNVFEASQDWYQQSEDPLTIDGFQLNNEGNVQLANYLSRRLFDKNPSGKVDLARVNAAVQDKNWFWHHDYKIPNGVHVYGRRYNPFGPDNYPAELQKIREMTDIRDRNIWASLQGTTLPLDSLDAQTNPLPPVATNYETREGSEPPRYLYGQEALDHIEVPEGYQIELFASEREFPDLANPVQLSFDNQGRLWVATMPTYPHYRPGDPKPNDKLIILEDTDGDGKADKQTTFAEGLHLPVGFEFAPEGVYVSQGTNLKLIKDTDGDDRADEIEIILSGFDDHDTHHVISAFCADPSGAILMGEGVFLHTNVETPYGTVRATNGGFYRYSPQRKRLERHAQLSIPNPWGIAFDAWGQHFFAETSGPDVRWMMPGSIKSRYGVATHKSYSIIEQAQRVRPTSGLEFVSSRHFPEEVQGDMLINNTIGFLGTKQHQMIEDGTGYSTKHRLDLTQGDDPNFRPVDMEFAPDGSLYLVDWHNVLIGHMQHNARDPLRDHVHGRIYRITYPSRPLVEPAEVAGASIETLLDNLKLPEYRTRYRTRRELRGRDQAPVLTALENWWKNLDDSTPEYERWLLEGLWVSWGMNQVNQELLEAVLRAEDHRVRAGGVRVLRYMHHQVDNAEELFQAAALDPHGRVRLEAIVASSWLKPEQGLAILAEAGKLPLDNWMIHAYRTAEAHLNNEAVQPAPKTEAPTYLNKEEVALYEKGAKIFEREGYCGTCHQQDGQGLETVGYPPLAGSEWVMIDTDRLIKLTLKGLYGPITVKGKQYDPKVPMTAYEGLMNDEEVAAVLTYVRNSWGNEGTVITPEQVRKVRAAVKDKEGYYEPRELELQ
ncbi:MAG TPA: PVC-type heme-binding CxxCH protein [Saprospiraceae bacterium]|nr:PVC-type heme-binding CxxCH protein [Saprospiraceae bacterium]